MSEILRPGNGILFMKVGTHAQESLADIIARKTQEIEEAGFAMWGYGGNTCHPSSMVQPFAQAFADRGEPIHLCMEEIDSNHFAEPLCAAEYSVDGLAWEKIPGPVEVRGSRYALVISHLHNEEFSLPLERTRVPIGKSAGRLGSRYISGRVDKACLEVVDTPERINTADITERSINLVAVLQAPYAVFLRNYR